jgi:O-antigen/teichoic acid export membrane protein
MLKAALTRLAKGSLIYGIGGMLQRFMGLLLLPFFTRVLTPQDYGVVALVSLVSVAMSGLFTLGTGNSMGLLYYRELDIAKRPTIIWSNVLLLTGNAVFWYSLVFVSAPMLSALMFQSDRYADLIRLAILGSVFSTIADPWLAYLRLEEKAKRYVVITLISSLLSIGLSIWFVLVQGIGVKGVILAGTLAQGIMFAVIWLMIGRELPFHINPSLFRPLVRIGFPSIFGLFSFLLIDYADRQMIERLVSLDALGVYSVGYSFAMVMSITTGAFGTAWPPFFMSYLNRQNEARIIFARVLTYYLIGFGALIVLFFPAAKPIVLMMTAPSFHEAHMVVGLVAAGFMLKGCYLITLPGIYFAGKLHKQSAVEWVAAIANIGLNLWLIPLFGIVGAALATFISYLTLPIFAWLVARHYLTVDYEWQRLVKISMAILLASALLYFLSARLDIGLVSTIIINAAVLLLFVSLTYRLLMTTYEREQLWSRLRS